MCRSIAPHCLDERTAMSSAGLAPTRLTPTRERRESSGIQCWIAGPNPDAQRAIDLWDAAQAIREDIERIEPLTAA